MKNYGEEKLFHQDLMLKSNRNREAQRLNGDIRYKESFAYCPHKLHLTKPLGRSRFFLSKRE